MEEHTSQYIPNSSNSVNPIHFAKDTQVSAYRVHS